MNHQLTEQIVKHIFSNLGIIKPAVPFNDRFQKLVTNTFLLNKKISFEMEDGSIVSNNLWGCQLKIDNQELKIIVGDVSRDVSVTEYCLVVHLQDYPMYGIYYIVDATDTQSLIGYSVNGQQWLECNTYLQATFLAAMEQIKEHFALPQQCSLYEVEYSALLTFLDFHSTIFENNVYER